MDVLQNLALGFAMALTPGNLLACLAGVFMGTLVGILPGLGPAGALAMLLPITAGMSPTASLIMLAGLFYGSKYGGAITSVLANMPGESSSIVTCMEGYPLAKQGRAGAALGMSAFASFFAGTLSVVGLMLVGPPLGEYALGFGPPEYFAMMALGLTLVVFLAGKSMVKALLMGCFGLALSTVGTDVVSGARRLTFGQLPLLAGIDFVVVAVGLFAVGEILLTLDEKTRSAAFVVPDRLRDLLPTLQDLKESLATLFRSTIIGFLVGCVPGGTTSVATFLAYGATKALARDPQQFGTGNIRGVAAGESADNAAASGNLVPLLTLGIPGNATTAILLAALIMGGLQPGPLLLKQQPELFWTIIASMYIGNVMLLVMNLPLVPLFANLLRVPYYIQYPVILGVCGVGVYSVNNRISDVWLMAVFGVLGYFMKKLDLPAAPVVLALVLGGMIEKALRQSLIIFDGNLLMFASKPVATALLVLTVVMLAIPVARWLRAAGSGPIQYRVPNNESKKG